MGTDQIASHHFHLIHHIGTCECSTCVLTVQTAREFVRTTPMWPSPAVHRGKQCTHFPGSFGWDFQHGIPSGLLVPGVHPSGSLLVPVIRLKRAGDGACGWAEQRKLQLLGFCVCAVRWFDSVHQPNSSLQLAPVRLRALIRTTVLLIRGESLDCGNAGSIWLGTNGYDHCKLVDPAAN